MDGIWETQSFPTNPQANESKAKGTPYNAPLHAACAHAAPLVAQATSAISQSEMRVQKQNCVGTSPQLRPNLNSAEPHISLHPRLRRRPLPYPRRRQQRGYPIALHPPPSLALPI